ncbi:MAG: flavodoxin [Clostridiales bacterium]|nr:flavodoxin [Clostridiales bacterium]
MNTVIVYYSMHGNTAYVAKKIASELHADVIEIQPEKQYPDKGIRKFLWGGKSAVMAETPTLKPYEFHAEKYDQVIFGFPVWAGNVTPPLRTFARDHLEELKSKRIAAFACQGGSGAEKAFRKLSECLGGATLAATLVLIDPKDKPKPENDVKIMDFCAGCKG